MALWRMILVGVVISMFSVGTFALVDESLSSQIASVQERVVGLPLSGMVASYFGDELVNIHVDAVQGDDFVVGVQSVDSTISRFEIATLENPDVDIYVSETALLEMLGGSDIRFSLGRGLDDGSISYTAHGFFNKIKYAIVVSKLKGQVQSE